MVGKIDNINIIENWKFLAKKTFNFERLTCKRNPKEFKTNKYEITLF